MNLGAENGQKSKNVPSLRPKLKGIISYPQQNRGSVCALAVSNGRFGGGVGRGSWPAVHVTFPGERTWENHYFIDSS